MKSGKIKTMFHKQIKRIQLAIKLLILVIFLGYIMIWIMMPTNIFWLHWLPCINVKANSTYFGDEGTNILIYCFPILLIATLGCLYLHLEKYDDDTKYRIAKDSNLALWRQPVLVKGPLGIVSWTELSFVLMFIALLVWSFSSYVYGMFKNISTQSSSKMGEHVWEVRLDSVALLLGLVGNICLSFLFFPVSRTSPILRLVGLTSESSIKYHIWLGHTVLTIFLSHGLCYAVFWANTHQISEMLQWDNGGISNVAGEIALLAGLAIWITSVSRIRRKLFELFFYTHHLYIVFVCFFVLHVGFSYSCIMLPGFYLFLIDRFLRFLQSQQSVCLISARILPCRAIELNLSKDPRLSYNPSSVIFINVKSVSKLQWHPFTVTSNNNTDPSQLSIVIKTEGKWSQKLYERLSSPTPVDRLAVSVEGPYSPPPSSTSYLRHDMLVMVSGGSGITPFISIIRELIFIANTTGKAPKALLIATFKNSADLTMINHLLPFHGSSHEISRLDLQIQAYVTRDTGPPTLGQKAPTNIRFTPSGLDRPVVGSNSWLCLGAIISSSFIVFLVLISVLNRYYIPPIQHNTSIAHSHATISIIRGLSMCSSVVMVASLAFVWNKSWHNTKDERRIESAADTPESGRYEAGRELESDPMQQSFKQVTTVHFGERPNFKNILWEYCEGSNVGVLVSGPEKMRQDVAALCSSTCLNYQSFSFNW